jgi:hypothetical protein
VCVFLQFFYFALWLTYRPLTLSKSQRMTDRLSKFLSSPTYKASTSIQHREGGPLRVCFLISGLLNQLLSHSATTHWSVTSPGDTLKALKRPITGRFGGESPVAGISVPGLITQGSHCCVSFRGLCFSAQAQSLERSLLRLRPGGSS